MKFRVLLFLLFVTNHLSGQVDFTKPFNDCGVVGSITIYDYNAKKWIFSNPSDSQIGTLPASTFKILHTMIILETGALIDENEMVHWHENQDTAKYGYRPNIYHDMGLKEAFKSSAGWVYVELAKKIGKQHYGDYLARSYYGNGDLSIDDLDFWNFGNFAVTPVNQIELLIGVYEETLPFLPRTFKIVKEMMVEEKTDVYILHAKTGWARDGGKDTGWWIGYVERDNNVYFFATRLIKSLKATNPNFSSCRKTITRNILKQLNVLD